MVPKISDSGNGEVIHAIFSSPVRAQPPLRWPLVGPLTLPRPPSHPVSRPSRSLFLQSQSQDRSMQVLPRPSQTILKPSQTLRRPSQTIRRPDPTLPRPSQCRPNPTIRASSQTLCRPSQSSCERNHRRHRRPTRPRAVPRKLDLACHQPQATRLPRRAIPKQPSPRRLRQRRPAAAAACCASLLPSDAKH